MFLGLMTREEIPIQNSKVEKEILFGELPPSKELLVNEQLKILNKIHDLSGPIDKEEGSIRKDPDQSKTVKVRREIKRSNKLNICRQRLMATKPVYF